MYVCCKKMFKKVIIDEEVNYTLPNIVSAIETYSSSAHATCSSLQAIAKYRSPIFTLSRALLTSPYMERSPNQAKYAASPTPETSFPWISYPSMVCWLRIYCRSVSNSGALFVSTRISVGANVLSLPKWIQQNEDPALNSSTQSSPPNSAAASSAA